MTSGYLHADYARSLAEIGEPYYLPTAEGWIFKRRIPGSDCWDAMGAYPLFNCRRWRELDRDLRELQGELVDVTVVTDPFGDYLIDDLRRAFPSLVRPFKQHFIIDLRRPLRDTVCAHHRRNAQKALRSVEVERCDPVFVLGEWLALYDQLIARHKITGLAAFSPASFAGQLRVPGLVALRAVHQQETVGMMLCYVNDDRAYYHLAAYSPRGYQLKASFALFWRASEILAAEGVRWMNLGAGAGIDNDGTDGLSRFKRGWATATRVVYLCGRILDQRAYADLAGTAAKVTGYFPAYRAPVRPPIESQSWCSANYDSCSRQNLPPPGLIL